MRSDRVDPIDLYNYFDAMSIVTGRVFDFKFLYFDSCMYNSTGLFILKCFDAECHFCLSTPGTHTGCIMNSRTSILFPI